jgi:chromosome segregation ATPase
MPTNKLWIEHTERAAWESVKALRSELAEANKRLERLTPPVEGWQALFGALDAAKEDHALGGKTYAEILRGLLDRLTLAEARLRAAQEGLARAHLPAAPAPTASSTNVRQKDSEAPASEPMPDFTALARRFVRAMQRRYEAISPADRPLGVDEALAAVSAKVDELAAMDEIELADAAVDLAVLALCIHKEAQSGP